MNKKVLCISEEGLIKNALTINEVAMMLNILRGFDEKDIINNLIHKEYIGRNPPNLFGNVPVYSLTSKGKEALEDLFQYDLPTGMEDSRMDELVSQLQEVFPEGKKAGTSYYWRGGKAEIKKKLETLFKRYDVPYTNEEIIAAAKQYVDSFGGATQYMQLLKYFIWKDKPGECQSELLAHLEHSKEENTHNEELETHLV